jgi:hypothetical protein
MNLLNGSFSCLYTDKTQEGFAVSLHAAGRHGFIVFEKPVFLPKTIIGWFEGTVGQDSLRD